MFYIPLKLLKFTKSENTFQALRKVIVQFYCIFTNNS